MATVTKGEARFRVIAAIEPEAIPLVDWRRLENVTFGEPDFLAEVLSLFFAEADRQIGVLGAAVRSGASDEALKAAHALKGAAANIGADQLRELASELESVIRAGGLEFTQPLVDRLRDAQVATRAALEAA